MRKKRYFKVENFKDYMLNYSHTNVEEPPAPILNVFVPEKCFEMEFKSSSL